MAVQRRHLLFSWCAALLATEPAGAGAWLLQEGSAKAILTWSEERASAGFDLTGDVARELTFIKDEARLYAEYGLSENWMAIGQTGWQRAVLVEGDDPVQEASSGFSGLQLGLQRKITDGDHWVLSGQVSGVLPGEVGNVPGRSLGFGSVEAEARILGGYGARLGPIDGFVDLQTGYRWRSDERDDWVFDATLGAKYRGELLLMAQTFTRNALGDERASILRESETALHLSAALHTRPGAFQVGYRNVLDGRGAVQNDGWFVAYWARLYPGDWLGRRTRGSSLD